MEYVFYCLFDYLACYLCMRYVKALSHQRINVMDLEDIRLDVIKHRQWFKVEIYELKTSMKALRVAIDVYGTGFVDANEHKSYFFAR